MKKRFLGVGILSLITLVGGGVTVATRSEETVVVWKRDEGGSVFDKEKRAETIKYFDKIKGNTEKKENRYENKPIDDIPENELKTKAEEYAEYLRK